MRKIFYSLLLALVCSTTAVAQRYEKKLTTGWKFHNGDVVGAQSEHFDDRKWDNVRVPHDWAIFGPFDIKNDLQNVKVVQDLEKQASLKTGRTGGLPYIGIGWYRNTFYVEPGRKAWIILEGAMNEPTIYVNGQKAGFYPNGYNNFAIDITPYIHKDGSVNNLAVRLQNHNESSRWYPGAGLFRPVKLITTGSTRVPMHGQVITTPHINNERATINICTPVESDDKDSIIIRYELRSPDRKIIKTYAHKYNLKSGNVLKSNLNVRNPQLWSPETPVLYTLITTICDTSGNILDNLESKVGIRSIEYVPEEGFFLNGKYRQIKGVCIHHDLGALGAASNSAAITYRLKMLKDMGCDAIRSSHNVPSPELVRQCDSLGFMMLIEPFDEWDKRKCKNGYHRYFNEWAEKDVAQMVRQFRNHPSVIMWGIGNEVPNQGDPNGWRVVKMLQDVCHREDPTRPVTVCMNSVTKSIKTDFAKDIDIPGVNYNTRNYNKVLNNWTQGLILGSETSSTVSSRGIYYFPIQVNKKVMHPEKQSSSYDVERPGWANIPDIDFKLAEQNKWYIGQFVWTGFDYIGEPTPYNTNAWPNHTSLFGIIDLANIQKDRYYLYRSQWKRDSHTLHVLPSWNFEGNEGQVVPVFAYTDAPEAELFVNGKSQGRQHKYSFEEVEKAEKNKDKFALMRRYRLIWDNVKYEPGEIEVVAYYDNGRETLRKKMKTAGRPYALKLEANKKVLNKNGDDLIFITVTVVDKEGNPCLTANNMVDFRVKGAARFRAAANGDVTDLHEFHKGVMPAFSGMLQAIIESNGSVGGITVEATSKGLKKGSIKLECK